MFKKIVATVLAGVMTLSLAGCGEKDTEDFYSMMSALESVKNATYTGSVTLNDYGKSEKASLDYSGVLNEDGEMTLQASMSVDMGDIKTNGALNVLDIVLKGDTAYINTSKLISSIGALAGQDDSGMLDSIAGLSFGADWLKIESGDEMSEDIAVPDLSNTTSSLRSEYIPMLKALNQSLSGIEPAVIGAENGKYFFYISDKNADAVVAALSTALEEGKFNDIIQGVRGETNKSVSEIITEARSALNSLQSFECRIEISKTAGVTSINGYFDDKSSSIRYDFGISLSAVENKLEIAAPEGAITLEEALSQVMGGVFGGDISGFEDITGTDDLEGLLDFGDSLLDFGESLPDFGDIAHIVA